MFVGNFLVALFSTPADCNSPTKFICPGTCTNFETILEYLSRLMIRRFSCIAVIGVLKHFYAVIQIRIAYSWRNQTWSIGPYQWVTWEFTYFEFRQPGWQTDRLMGCVLIGASIFGSNSKNSKGAAFPVWLLCDNCFAGFKTSNLYKRHRWRFFWKFCCWCFGYFCLLIAVEPLLLPVQTRSTTVALCSLAIECVYYPWSSHPCDYQMLPL